MISKKVRRLLAGAMLGFLFTALPVSAQTSNAPAIVRQGYALLNRGWVDDAIDTFRQALQAYPQSLDAKLGLAIAYQKAGRDTDAWQAYQQVLTQAPSNRSALAAIGQLGSYRPEWQQGGIAALTTLLELTPNDAAARAQRAQLYAYQGEFAEAIADYEVLLSATPTPETLLGAAQAYTYSGDYQQGVALFDRYQASGKPIPDSAATAYAFALQQVGNPKAAIQFLEPRLKPSLDETSIQVRAALASAYAADRQIQQAISTLEPLQDRPEAVLPLARSLSSIGRQAQDETLYEGAVLLYQRVLQQTSNPSATLLIEAADVLSDAPEHQDQALQLYEQALALQADNSSVQVKQLVLQQQLGQISRADLQQQLKTLLGGLPTEAGEQRSLALALLRIDPPNPEFLPLFQSALQNGADVPFFNFRIAQIYLQQNDLAAARTAASAYGATPVGTQDPATEFLLAEIDRLEGNLDGSAQRYQTVIDRSLGDEVTRDATRGLAGIRLAQAQPGAALQLYKQLLAANPKDAVSQLGEAAISYQLQQISEADATAVLDRWQQTQPRSATPPELFTLVGVLPADTQREAIYDRLLEADPQNIPVNLRWVQLWAIRDPDKAKARVEQLLASDRIGAYFVQGELGQTLGDLTLAAQSYEAILAAQPNNPNALSALGGVRFQQRRFNDAVALYSRVLELRPNDLDTRRILAELRLAQDRPFTALQELQNLQHSDQSSDQPADSATSERVQRLQVDILRRRGFQPSWERY
ncbi:tetratricopeptide repeat protein [Phormidium tenue FACHB-886]|nr:tetratricopeptide repeat protein [Phormidium tenue FACHB-886]